MDLLLTAICSVYAQHAAHISRLEVKAHNAPHDTLSEACSGNVLTGLEVR